MSRPLRLILAIISLLLGVAGIFLPILQAWFFFGLALVLLSPDVPVFKKWIVKIERRYPRIGRSLRKVQEKIGRAKSA